MNFFQVLIILDLAVERTADEVGGKIGEPVMYDPNKNPPQNQQTASRPAPSAVGMMSMGLKGLINLIALSVTKA